MIDYKSLQTLLEKRLTIIADTALRDSDPDKQLQQLMQVSQDITQWSEQNKGIPQQLNHYLKQSSLSKALDFIKTSI
jgi:predicted phage-related endonuclease